MPRGLPFVAISALLALSAVPADAARQKPIRGKLTASGYTLVALATNGKVTTKRVGRRFSLRPPGRVVTLHLRGQGAVYAGPIVVGRRRGGRRAVVGVRAGARLGRIVVVPENGYARVARKPRRRAIDRSRIARARKGVPIGARLFGQVRSKPPRRPPRGDRDLDGIPDHIDIDDDGDRVLDKVDRSRLGRARTSAVTAADPLGLATGLGAPLHATPNLHARGSGETLAQVEARIDQASKDLGYIIMNIPFGISAVELDCGPPVPAGLSYCALGGSAVARGKSFPECCDGDGDGYGTMVPTDVQPDFQNFDLDHRSNSTQIVTGNQIFHHVTKSGGESQCPDAGNPNCVSYQSTQGFAFTTTPALKSFDDGPGGRVPISYPVDFEEPGNTANNPIRVSARSGGDVILDLTLWRPQRRPTSDAECGNVPGCAVTDWLDMGGLVYFATGNRVEGGDPAVCPKEGAYSNPSEGLQAFELEAGESGGFLDTTGARRADPANTLSYRVNLTKCLATKGISFNKNQTRGFAFQASPPTDPAGGLTGTDTASQNVYLRRAD